MNRSPTQRPARRATLRPGTGYPRDTPGPQRTRGFAGVRAGVGGHEWGKTVSAMWRPFPESGLARRLITAAVAIIHLIVSVALPVAATLCTVRSGSTPHSCSDRLGGACCCSTRGISPLEPVGGRTPTCPRCTAKAHLPTMPEATCDCHGKSRIAFVVTLPELPNPNPSAGRVDPIPSGPGQPCPTVPSPVRPNAPPPPPPRLA
jgi:hypothetical protein